MNCKCHQNEWDEVRDTDTDTHVQIMSLNLTPTDTNSDAKNLAHPRTPIFRQDADLTRQDWTPHVPIAAVLGQNLFGMLGGLRAMCMLTFGVG